MNCYKNLSADGPGVRASHICDNLKTSMYQKSKNSFQKEWALSFQKRCKDALTFFHKFNMKPGRCLRTEVRGDFNIHGTKYF